MSAATVLFRMSLGLVLVGGSLAVFASWAIAQPGEPGGGANIGAGFLSLLATGLMGLAVLLWVVGLIARSAGRRAAVERGSRANDTP